MGLVSPVDIVPLLPEDFRRVLAARETGSVYDSVVADNVLQSFNEAVLTLRGHARERLDGYFAFVELILDFSYDIDEIASGLELKSWLNL
jgi:hypothetical protein